MSVDSSMVGRGMTSPSGFLPILEHGRTSLLVSYHVLWANEKINLLSTKQMLNKWMPSYLSFVSKQCDLSSTIASEREKQLQNRVPYKTENQIQILL